MKITPGFVIVLSSDSGSLHGQLSLKIVWVTEDRCDRQRAASALEPQQAVLGANVWRYSHIA